MLLLLALSGCSTSEQTKKPEEQKQAVSEKKVELTISAAASLQNALTDIKAEVWVLLNETKDSHNIVISGQDPSFR
jgi:molybdate transport system substrate-binding protein